MKRLFTLAAALSLVLCVCVGAWMARSYWWCDEHEFAAGADFISFNSQCGRLQINWCPGLMESGASTVSREARPVRYVFHADEICPYHVAGFGFGTNSFQAGPSRKWHTNYEMVVPHWCLVTFTLVLPAVWLLHRLRPVQLRRNSRCSKCGYDLRAAPERCPECGTAVEAREQGATT